MNVGVLFLAVLGRVFFALARSALVNIRRPRLVELEQRGVASARAIQQLTDNSGRFLATAEIGALLSQVTAAAVAADAFTAPLLERLLAIAPISPAIAHTVAFAVVVFVTALTLFIFGRLVPEAIAVRHTEPIALALVRPMQAFSVLLAPLVRFAVVFSNALSIPFGGQKRESATLVTEAELKTMVDAGEEEGLIEIEEKEMILSVLDFGDTVAREVMVPRIDIVAIDAATPFQEALAVIVRAGHSRVPVHSGTIDDIVGVLYSKDLLRALAEGRTPAIETLLRPVTFTPEAKPVNDLLQELQTSRVHMCVVVDEFGGTAGLVTIEDILEEIVGEIQDEFDSEEPKYVALPDGSGYELDAGVHLDDVNELLHSSLSTESSDTLGGYIYDQLGKVPTPGDVVRADGLLMQVLSVRDRRILKVKVNRAPAEKEGDAADERRTPDDEAAQTPHPG
jgi:CBS domain containing-hemolysin-like protein